MDLTFAEQVKIVLSRKNMTIKQLAEEIQEKTGQKMSRQNLTQRLGRDNFQEQDMRMIADILGCPFQLNILDVVEEEEGQAEIRPVRKRAGRKSAAPKEVSVTVEKEPEGNDVTVGDMLDIMDSVSEVRDAELMRKVVMPDIEELKVPEETETEEAEVKETEAEEAPVSESETGSESTRESDVKTGGESAPETTAETAGGEISDRADAETGSSLEEGTESGSESTEEISEAGETQQEKKSEEPPRQERHIINADSGKKSVPKWEPKPEPKRVDRSGIWNRREEVIRRKKENHPHAEWIGATPQSRSKDFMKDASQTGEINPYTGKEYETNSVRMHPKRIGYIQVYDRGNHKWTDMTEWAFLGFQEQKKSLLGSDYDEPIYLE